MHTCVSCVISSKFSHDFFEPQEWSKALWKAASAVDVYIALDVAVEFFPILMFVSSCFCNSVSRIDENETSTAVLTYLGPASKAIWSWPVIKFVIKTFGVHRKNI